MTIDKQWKRAQRAATSMTSTTASWPNLEPHPILGQWRERRSYGGPGRGRAGESRIWLVAVSAEDGPPEKQRKSQSRDLQTLEGKTPEGYALERER